MSPSDDFCTDVALGATCSVTLTSTDSNDLTECVNADTATPFQFYCPWDVSSVADTLIVSAGSFRCQTCGDITFEDENEDGGALTGTLYWGPNLKTMSGTSSIDESMLDGYAVQWVGSCMTQINTTIVWQEKHDVQSTCCNDMEYSFELDEEIPADAVAIKISPYKGSDILTAGRILYYVDIGGMVGSANGVFHANIGIVTCILSIVACVATSEAVIW
jgi:hypothetical protein